MAALRSQFNIVHLILFIFIINENGAMELRGAHCAVSKQPTAMTRKNSGLSPCKIKDKDFSGSFDGER